MDTDRGVNFKEVPGVSELAPQAKTEIPFTLIFGRPQMLTCAFVLVYQIASQKGTNYYSRFGFSMATRDRNNYLIQCSWTREKAISDIPVKVNRSYKGLTEELGPYSFRHRS